MVDFSNFYFLWKYFFNFILFLTVTRPIPTKYLLWVLAIEFSVISFTRGNEKNKKLFAHLSAACFALLMLWYGADYISPFLGLLGTILGISQRNAAALTGFSILLLVTAFCYIKGSFHDKKPVNTSRLNKRQTYLTIGGLLLIALAFFSLWYVEYGLFQKIILGILFIAEIISLIFWFYDPLIYVVSHFWERKIVPACPKTPGRQNRLAVLACAHNEEKVIGELIRSLQENDYPARNYDLYVICDNCTDSTAEIVRQHGAIPMERQDSEKRGKGFALEWMFGILQEKRSKSGGTVGYDAYIVLDADNVVNRQFLSEINRKLNEGYEIMQAYLGCKNPGDTWVSKCHSLSYWVSNALYQKAHAKLGLSAQMGGTGMVIRPSVLDEIGWETDSLTEDLVLTTRYVMKKNRSCYWLHDARLYDEKPLNIQPSVKQRTRWMQGHMDAMFKYALPLLGQGLMECSLKKIDISFYLMRPLLNLILFICYIARWTGVLLFPGSFISRSFLMNFNTAVILVASYLLIQLYILIEEKYIKYFYWIPIQWFFTYTWYLPILRGLIKHKERFWVSTIHQRNLSLADIREDHELAEAGKQSHPTRKVTI